MGHKFYLVVSMGKLDRSVYISDSRSFDCNAYFY